jgi:hypothetical protein
MILSFLQAPSEAECRTTYDSAVKGRSLGGVAIAEVVAVKAFEGGDEPSYFLQVLGDAEIDLPGWVARVHATGRDGADAIAVGRKHPLVEAALPQRAAELERLKTEEPADFQSVGKLSEAIVGVSGGR